MKPRNFTPIAMSLLAGTALGYCLRSLSSPAPAPESGWKTALEQVVHRNRGDHAESRVLRTRNKELEAMLAKQRAEIEKMIEGSEGQERARSGFRAMLERLKTEDPDSYALMTNSLAQARQSCRERAQSKIDFLSSIDTSEMPSEVRLHHERLLRNIDDKEKIRRQIEDMVVRDMDMDEKQLNSLYHSMFKTHVEILTSNRIEREYLFGQIAKALGFSGDDAKEISETAMGICDATDDVFVVVPPPSRGAGGKLQSIGKAKGKEE